MAFLPTNATSVQAFAGALYGLQIGTATMTQVNNDITSFGGLNNALNAYYSASFGSTATATVAANLVANIGISAANSAAAVSYVTGVLNATAASARGAAVMNILNQLASLSSDATFGADATAWNTKVANSVAYNGSADAAVGTVVNQTFTLTTGVDNVTGTAGSDTISGVVDTKGTTSTYQSGDQINGGAGADTLSLIVTGDGTGAAPGVVNSTGVEVLKVQDLATAGANTFNLANFTGLTEIQLANGTNAASTSFTNVSGVNTITLKDLATAGVVGTVTLSDTGLSGTADAVTVNLNNVTSAQTLTVQTTTTASGIETLNVVSGAVKSTGAVTLVSALQTGVTKQTVNVSGSTDLSLAVSTGMTTVNASSLSGALKLDVSGSANYTVTGGTGANRYNFAGNFNASDKVAGGTGVDTLAISGAAVDSTVAGYIDGKTSGVANNSSIDVLELTGTAAETIDASLIQMSTLRGYKSSGAVAATSDAVGLAVTGQANDQTFTISGNITGGVGAASANGAKGVTFAPTVDNSANTLNLTLSGVTITGGAAKTGGNGNGGAAVDVSNYETVNITSTGATATAVNTLTGGAKDGTGAVGATLIVSANTAINLSGANEISLGAISSSNTPVTVNAANLAGKMTVTTGTAADVITGGSGVNLITLSGGADTVDLSKSAAKADVVALTSATGTTGTAFVQITGFTNASTTGDKLDVINTGAAVTDKAAGQVSGVTNLTFAVSSGVMTFAGSAAATATLADKITAAFSVSAINTTQYAVLAFEHNGSTYVVESTDTTQGFNAGTDEVIQLVGVTGVTALSAAASAANTIFVV